MHSYIKVSSNNELVKYPYTWFDLSEENNNTAYDDRFSLAEWYAKTDEANLTQQILLPVVQDSQPDISESEVLFLDNPPVFKNGNWTLEWSVRTKTQAEIQAAQALL